MTIRNIRTLCQASSLARLSSFAVLPLTMLSLACSADAITMGEDGAGSAPVPSDSRCAESPQVTGDVTVTNQREIELLEGCEAIEGDLVVIGFAGADLRPLHALRAVSGLLHLGGDPNGEPAPDPSVEGSWLQSLAGLESLESAGALLLSGLVAEDVEPLGSLRVLTTGMLWVMMSPNLVDLGGLAQLRGVTDLLLSCEALESIDGLVLPEEMKTLTLSGANLSQLKSIGVRTITDSLEVRSTGLTNLEAFSGLRQARSVGIGSNAALESMDGLNSLQFAESLAVYDNQSLTRLPEFSQLRQLNNLMVRDNERLTTLSEFPLLFLQPTYIRDALAPEELLGLRPDVIDISSNASLTAVALPVGWLSGAAMMIEDNAALTQVEFTRQRSVDYLSIQNNPVLGSLVLGELATVNRLDLINNPSLEPTAFDTVRTFETNLSSSALAP
jgi:hypothetical protein